MSEYGWARWCAENMPCLLSKASSFSFTLRPDANVIRLRGVADVLDLVNMRPEFVTNPLQDNYKVCLDFERMVGSGVDVLEISIKKLDQMFEGWDCDSLLVMNPDVVVTI